MKRIIKMAADGGYDKVAFANGEQNAEHYDLSKQISRVEYTDTGTLVATDINGREALREQVPENKIEDYIGKEAARKLLESKPVRDPGRGDINAKTRRIDGDGLIGGEGMKAFYDAIIPNTTNALLKKLGGGKVEMISLPKNIGNQTASSLNRGNLVVSDIGNGFGVYDGPSGDLLKKGFKTREEAQTWAREHGGLLQQPGFTITPSLRGKAAGGMPLFQRKQSKSSLPPVAQSVIDTIINRINGVRQATGDARITVTATPAELPVKILEQAKLEGIPENEIHGVLYKGHVYIVRQNLKTKEDVEEVLLHEVLGHGGANALFGEAKNGVLAEAFARAGGIMGLRAAASRLGVLDELNTRIPSGELTPKQKIAVVDEMLALAQGKTSKLQQVALEWWNKVRNHIISALNALGFTNTAARLDKFDASEAAVMLRQMREAVIDGGDISGNGVSFMTVWHGSQHKFDKFSTAYMGTGEGAQAYGWGLYFAGSRAVAEYYKNKLSTTTPSHNTLDGKRITKKMAESLVESEKFTPLSGTIRQMTRQASLTGAKDLAGIATSIANEYQKEADRLEALSKSSKQQEDSGLLISFTYSSADYKRFASWEQEQAIAARELSKRLEFVKEKKNGTLYQVELAPKEDEYLYWDKPLSEQSQQVKSAIGFSGKDEYANEFYNNISFAKGSDKAASLYLKSIGIPGIKFLDGSSRSKGEGNYNYVIFDDADVEVKALFSRSPTTKASYESRIDALFAGGKANLSGVHLLDKSDVLDLLGLGNMPVRLDESKVVLNQTNHPEMTAEIWKKIPEWMDSPALVAKSSTVQGRYVITPLETVQGYPIRIIVEPKGGSVQVHALVNAYAPMGSNGALMEIKRIEGQIRRGDVAYVDKKKADELLGRSGLQLPRVPSLNTDRNKILTEKNLAGYRKANNPQASNTTSGIANPTTVAALQQAIQEITGTVLPNQLGSIVATTASEIKSTWEPLIGNGINLESEGNAGHAQAFFDPTTDTIFLIADHIEAGTETAVVGHELMHKHGQAVLGEAGWNKLHSVIEGWKDAQDGTDERRVYDDAMERVNAVGQALSSEELFPYAVEAAILMGIKPNAIAKQGTVARWLADVKKMLQEVWGKLTNKPESFKAQDLVDLAFGIAQRERHDVGRVSNLFHAPEVRNAAGKLLAPNGKVSKLTEAQWHQVRSPEFKQWFGDFEAAANKHHLQSNALAKVTGAEFGAGFDAEPVSMPELRKAAGEWANKNLAGVYTNKRSGLELEVRKSGIEQAIQHGGAADKLRAFAGVSAVLTDGVVVFDGENPKNPRGRLVVVSGKVTINRKDFYVTAGFREDANGRLFYDHELMGVDRADQLLSQRGESLSSNHPLLSAHLNSYTVEYLSQDVQASKVVDANGEPMIVYHGSASGGHSVFRVEGGRDKPPGVFSTDSELVASTYSGWDRTDSATAIAFKEKHGLTRRTVYASYLSLKDPMVVNYKGADAQGSDKDGNDVFPMTDAFVIKAIENGNDGLIIKSVVDRGPYRTDEVSRKDGTSNLYVAVRPDQIKAVTGNTGAYGQRPITEAEAANVGMTQEDANKAQKAGDIRFSRSIGDSATKHAGRRRCSHSRPIVRKNLFVSRL